MILYSILRPQLRVEFMHPLNDQAGDKGRIITTCNIIPYWLLLVYLQVVYCDRITVGKFQGSVSVRKLRWQALEPNPDWTVALIYSCTVEECYKIVISTIISVYTKLDVYSLNEPSVDTTTSPMIDLYTWSVQTCLLVMNGGFSCHQVFIRTKMCDF